MAAVFVRGFEFDTQEETVRKFFSPMGEITEIYFQSRDSVVVRFEKEESAEKAAKELHEKTMEGQSRYVTIKIDGGKGSGKGKGKGDRDGGKGSGKGKDKGDREPVERKTFEKDTSIYISGFDTSSTDELSLKAHFGDCGEIVEIYFQSRGSAVIAFKDTVGAKRAVDDLHESTIKGQSRYVSVRMNDSDRGKGSGKGSSKGGGKDRSHSGEKIVVSGFEYETEEALLSKHFGKVGDIVDIYFQSGGSAVITYKDAETADRAVTTLDGTTMQGQQRYVAVKIDDPNRSKGKGKGKGKDRGKGYGKGKY